MALSRYPRYALIAAALVAALALAIALFPWHVLRGPLASYASYRLQRDVTIGDLDVALGRITRVQLDDVAIGNARLVLRPAHGAGVAHGAVLQSSGRY